MHQSQLCSLFEKIRNVLVVRCFAFVMSRRKAFVGRPRSPRDILASHAEFIRLPGRRFCSIPFSTLVACARFENICFYIDTNASNGASLVFRLRKHSKRCQELLLKYPSMACIPVTISWNHKNRYTWEIFNFAFNICILYFIGSISEIIKNNLLDTILLYWIIDYIYIYIHLNLSTFLLFIHIFRFYILKRNEKMRCLKYRVHANGWIREE